MSEPDVIGLGLGTNLGWVGLGCVEIFNLPWVGLGWVTENGPMDNSELYGSSFLK